jgi:hypothetical protein
VDANTILLLTLTGWANTIQIRGNGVASGSGTITRTPVSIAANFAQFSGQGTEVHSIGITVPPGNTGNVYVGVIVPPFGSFAGIFMGITAPYAGILKVFAPTDTGTYNIPTVSYEGANSLPIDPLFVDFATIGDVALASGFQV